MGKEVTPIYWGIGCAIFRALSFGWKIEILGSIFRLVIYFLVRFSWNTKLYFTFKIWKGVECELEEISDLSLLTNQVIKVIYSYFKSLPK